PAYDAAVIGGGIVGRATAMALAAERRLSVVVLEAESRLAAHQSGNTSGVIHAGLYYKPGSLKARNCVEGREAMYRFCDEHGIRAERCGKLVVATEERELPRLDELERRGRANGLEGLERLGPEGIREREPHAAGIVPFRGEYHELAPDRRALVRSLIYPVPDPAFPFLGVHFTRTPSGTVEAGPNAVLALKREGYSAADVRLRDLVEMGLYPGFWWMCGQHWRTGLAEMYRSISRHAFVKALQKLVPALGPDDVRYLRAGVRAQAVGPGGALLDDFHLVEAARSVHVLNAPSPAATASI